jgi:hypothetical protein
MTSRSAREDPTYYRFKYARIARLLEKETEIQREKDREVSREEISQGKVPEGEPPTPRLTLSPAASQAIAAALRGLTPEQESEGTDSNLLQWDAITLLLEAGVQLRRLRWRWVGRRPAWYVRLLGWHHRQRRREYLLLGEFLDRVLEPAIVILYFSCRLEEGFPVDAWDLPQPDGPLRRPWKATSPVSLKEIDSWAEEYLACLLSPWHLGEAPEEVDPPRAHRTLLWPLIWLVDRERRLLGWLGVTKLRPRPETHYRVRYNLACLFSRLAGNEEAEIFLNIAERQLQLSLEALHGTRRAALADRARMDPALETLRKAGGYRFERIVPSSSKTARS